MRRAAWALLLLAASAAAEKTVVRVTRDEKPVARAGVKVIDGELDFDRAAWKPDAFTDATGQAVVDLEDGEAAAVYVPGYAIAVVRGAGPLDVALRPERVFQGKVTTTQGEPIPNATIRLDTLHNRKATFRATTNAQGEFFVYGLWLDDYELTVEAAGFLSFRGSVPRDEVHLRLARPATLTVRVVDSEGAPLDGVEVTYEGDARRSEGGVVRFADLRAGPDELEIGWPYLTEPRWIELEEGEVREVEVVLRPPATWRLRVVDENEQPVDGAEVIREFQPLGATGEDGTLLVPVPDRRSVSFTIRSPDRTTFELELPGALGGHVHDAPIVVLRPLARVRVEVRDPLGAPVEEGFVDDEPLERGSAIVPVGSVVIRVPGHPPHWFEAEAPGPATFVLPAPAHVTGVVRNEAGETVAGATVAYRETTTQTDDEGRFRAGPFRSGAVVPFRAEHPEHGRAERTVTVREGALDLELARPPETTLLRGVVLRAGEPVPRFTVNGQRFVNEDGSFQIAVEGPDAILTILEGSLYVRRVPVVDEVVRIELPHVNVTIRGRPDDLVFIGRLTGIPMPVSPDDDGRLSCAVDPGRYRVSSTSGASVEFDVPPTGTIQVELPDVRNGWFELRLTRNYESDALLPGRFERQAGRLTPGLSGEAEGVYVSIRAMTVRPGEITVIEVDPAAGAVVRGQARPGASVEVESTLEDAVISYRVDAGADGRFELDRIAPGELRVRSRGEERRFRAAAGRTYELRFDDAARVLRGIVVDAAGAPVAGALVRLDEREARTDLAGAFAFGGLAVGRHRVEASLDGRRAAALVEVAADAEASVTLRLAPAIGMLRFEDPTGAPLPGLPVRVGAWRGATDALGRLPVTAFPAAVEVAPPRPGYARLRVTVTEPATIRLRRAAAVAVRYDPGEGTPELRRGDAPWPFETPLRPGLLELDDLPPGPLTLRLVGEDGAEIRKVVAELAAGETTVVDLREE